MTGGYSDFSRKSAANNTRDFKLHIEDVDLFVSFMEWGRDEAKRRHGETGYFAARNECMAFLLSCIREKLRPTLRAVDPPSALVGGGNSENSAGS